MKKIMCASITMARGQINYGFTVGLCAVLLLGACAEQPLMERVDQQLVKKQLLNEQEQQTSQTVIEVVALADKGQVAAEISQNVASGGDETIGEKGAASDVYLGNGHFLAHIIFFTS